MSAPEIRLRQIDATALAADPRGAGALRVVGRLREAGHLALLAGGCVRDLLLGRRPKDWDVVTDADPLGVMALFERTVPVGLRFGIVRVLLDGHGEYEVARFRREGPYADGRHPDHVEFSGPVEDARRRDFTMNGMFFDPCGGGLVDYVEGRADLVAGQVRAIGDPVARFAEDGLRALRAVRFAARLRFAIEARTWQAVKDSAALVDRISAERVRDELTLILTEGGAARGFELLYDSGLLARLLPEVAAMEGVRQSPEHHPEGDVWRHVRLMLAAVDRLEAPSPTLAWGVLLHDIGKPVTAAAPVAGRITFHEHDRRGADMVDDMARRLRMSTADRERIRDLTAHHMRFRNVRDMRPSKLKRFLREEYFPELLELHRIDCEASHGLLDLYDFCRQQQEAPPAALRPAPLLTGDDLRELGFTPGPLFGRILEWLEDEQLEGRLTSREQALEAVRSQWGDAAGIRGR